VVSRNRSAPAPMLSRVPELHHRDMARSYLFVSSLEPKAARRAVLASSLEIDLAVISPSDTARETAGYALDARWVFTVAEPLLAVRAFAESGSDAVARLTRAIRGLAAYDARAVLVVLDGLNLLGAGALTLNGPGLLRSADDLERAVPQL
jgi:hypothetical protein